MTSRELDAETTATAWLIAENIKTHCQLSDELFKAGLQIVNVLDTPQSEDELDTPQSEDEKVLGDSARDAAAAARLATQIADRIRHLSYQLRTLLDGEVVDDE